MMKKEADLWAKVRDATDRKVWAKRIEDSSGDLGTFDTVFMAKGKVLWVELKFGGVNAKPDMRRGQPAFGTKCELFGIPALVMMGHPDGSVKLMKGTVRGEDWREKLLDQWLAIDKDQMNRLLGRYGLLIW